MFTADHDKQEVRLDLNASTILRAERDGEELTKEKGKMRGSSSVPMTTFPNEAAAKKWVGHVYKSFFETFPERMTLLAADHLELVCNFLLNEYGFEKVDVREFIDSRAKYRARELKRVLKLSVVGNFSAWTRTDLARAVRAAILRLRKDGSKVTLASVARKLKATHGDAAPKSGDALGVLLTRNKLKWTEMKNRQ